MRAARAKARPERTLTKAEACKILRLAPTADAEMVTQAYWHLARKYRAAAGRDRRARQRLDELNRAYLVLHPKGDEPPPEPEAPPEAAQPPIIEELASWLRTVVSQTRSRWRGRVPEVAVIAATTAVLGFLALSAGADSLITVLTIGTAALAIWSPWRPA